MSKKIKISSFFLALILLMQLKLFYLPRSGIFYSINSNQQQGLMLVFTLLAIVALKFRPFIYAEKITNKYVLFFICYYFFELVVSSIRNKQGLVDAFISSNFYLAILFYYFLQYYFSRIGKESFYKYIVFLSFINIVICLAQYTLANKGIYFMNVSQSLTRFGTIRIRAVSDTTTCFAIIVCVVMFLSSTNKRKKWWYLVVGVLGVIGQLLVSKGRVTILAVFVGCCAVFISRYRKHLSKVLLSIALIVVAVTIFFLTPIGKTYYLSTTELSTENNTGDIRLREIAYYNEQTVQHPIMGVGFIRDNGDAMSNYLKGPNHRYSRTDIGIFGLANVFGIIGVVWFILLNIQLTKKLFYIRKHNGDDNYLIALGLMAYNIVYIPTMIMMNPYSITTLCILMSLIDTGYLMTRKQIRGF